MFDIKITDKKSKYFGQTLKGSVFYYDIKHTGDSDDLYIATTEEGKQIKFLSSQIDEKYYNSQRLEKVIAEMGANIGDTVVIVEGGSGLYKKGWIEDGPHIITEIDFAGYVTFDNKMAIIFKPKVKKIKEEQIV